MHYVITRAPWKGPRVLPGLTGDNIMHRLAIEQNQPNAGMIMSKFGSRFVVLAAKALRSHKPPHKKHAVAAQPKHCLQFRQWCACALPTKRSAWCILLPQRTARPNTNVAMSLCATTRRANGRAALINPCTATNQPSYAISDQPS